MLAITANDLKTKGIPVIENCLNHQDEAIITVRGKPRYVVMTWSITTIYAIVSLRPHCRRLNATLLMVTLFKKVPPTMLAVCWLCHEL